MNVITRQDFLQKEKFFLDEIKKGKIFIYPTDTIYGIGCDALNSEAVKKIREIKKRDEKPFSVIVWKEWIFDNCVVDENVIRWIDKLPGPYTLILKLKNKMGICKGVNNGADTIGVRIPNNWFARYIEKVKTSFVTTSVNITGEKHIEKISDLSDDIKENVDYIIDDGILNGRPSTIVKLTDVSEEIIKR